MIELILVMKGTYKKEQCASLDEAADIVSHTPGVLAYRCFQVSGKKNKRKKKYQEYEKSEE